MSGPSVPRQRRRGESLHGADLRARVLAERSRIGLLDPARSGGSPDDVLDLLNQLHADADGFVTTLSHPGGDA